MQKQVFHTVRLEYGKLTDGPDLYASSWEEAKAAARVEGVVITSGGVPVEDAPLNVE